jgi:hypothetical protein
MRREHLRWGSRRIQLEMLRRHGPWSSNELVVPSERTIDRILPRGRGSANLGGTGAGSGGRPQILDHMSHTSWQIRVADQLTITPQQVPARLRLRLDTPAPPVTALRRRYTRVLAGVHAGLAGVIWKGVTNVRARSASQAPAEPAVIPATRCPSHSSPEPLVTRPDRPVNHAIPA